MNTEYRSSNSTNYKQIRKSVSLMFRILNRDAIPQKILAVETLVVVVVEEDIQEALQVP